MKTMRSILMIGMLLLPSLVFASTDCRIVEYPDRYEAVCIGDEKPGPVQAQSSAGVQTNMMYQAGARAQVTALAQVAVTAQADAEKTPFVPRLSRRPNQAGQAVLAEAKAARNRLIMDERQKEPEVIAVAATM